MDQRQHVLGLNTTRLRLHHQAKAITDRAAAARRDLDAMEQAEFDRLLDRISEIDSERDQFTARETRENEEAALRESMPGVFGSDYGTRSTFADKAAERDYMVRWLTGDPSTPRNLVLPVAQLAEERKMLREGADPSEIRALLWDTTSIASAVPTLMARTIYGYLEAEMGMFRAPTTKITTDNGNPMQFPKVAAHTIGTQVIAQGTAIASTDPTFGRLQLDAYKYGSLVLVSNETLTDTAFDVGAFLASDMARAVSRNLGPDLVVGTGSGEPQGIMSAAGTGAAGTVATGGSLITPTYENLVDVVYSVNTGYRNSGACGWLMKDSTAAIVRKIRSDAGGTVGQAMWQPSLTQGLQGGEPDRLLGYPVYTDPSVASAGSAALCIGFGDFNSYYLRMTPVMFERDDSYAFNTDEATFRCKTRADGDLIDLAAWNRLRQAVA